MSEQKRNYEEIIAIATLEPGLKSIYVEGMSDYFLINDFLNHIGKKDVKVYTIDDIDLDDLYKRAESAIVSELKNSNKEQVIYLAQSLEQDLSGAQVPVLCIVDLDWDSILNRLRVSKYLSYTDYNSMDMYLCSKEVMARYISQGHRLRVLLQDSLLNSLLEVCRKVFHVHCLMHERSLPIINNDKSFSYDKSTQTCMLDFDKYWDAVLMKNGLMRNSVELRSVYNSRMAQPCADLRTEVQGHDFVYYLYLCVKKMKPKMSMDNEEFANMFWKYVDLNALKQEHLFVRIATM